MLAVYKIQCTVTGMYYIGSTHFLHTRLGAHRAALRRGTHDNSKLQRAWNKYGHAAFVFEHVASPLNAALLGPLEQSLIDIAMAEGRAFNLNRDVARPRLGAVNSAETRQRISAAKRGVRPSPEALAARREKMAGLPNPMQGRTQSEATKALISQRLKDGFANGRKPNIAPPSKEHNAQQALRLRATPIRQDKGKPLRGHKDGEVRTWLTTIACAKDLGCDLSYPSQRVGTGKLVKGWLLEYIVV